MRRIMFLDLEVDSQSHIRDIGAWHNNTHFHDSSIDKFQDFLKARMDQVSFICGHNIIHHDLSILNKYPIEKEFLKKQPIDTLYLSALLFPHHPYHKLVKDYKLVSEEPNNPVSDSKLAMRLLRDVIQQFLQLDVSLKTIYFLLLHENVAFRGFFLYLSENGMLELSEGIRKDFLPGFISRRFNDNLCINSDFNKLISDYPLELAFALALFNGDSAWSISPPWLMHRYPDVLQVSHRLRYNRCHDDNCNYCRIYTDARAGLKRFFGFDRFRHFEGDGEVPLQEQAVNAALDNKSFLAVFPTGGGKSVTFQLPALIKGEACRSLTVVISPLQSLMKDQVDILKNRHEYTGAVTINGLLSPLERAEAIERVENGSAHLLYISPESLRSSTIIKIIENRMIGRFVIDEAHCFSSWGQDFRVDYQYIGDFLRQLIKEKGLNKKIPVSCFTATAKPKVINDIKDYFQKKLGVELEVFKTTPKRSNLSFGIFYAASTQDKFSLLLNLLAQDEKPKIVYTSRVKRSEEMAEKLRKHGFNAAAYNGRMDSDVKIKIQDRFMAGDIDVIVATTAFGMGIDKEDISMVIHFNISGSLENYIQEAGRAGRNKEIKANCYVLFDDSDLMGHFSLLNASRLNKKEIYQVWQGIKKLRREKFSRSALELARSAGWDIELHGWDTRLKTALAALEDCGLIKRGMNQTRIFATGLQVKNMAEASNILQNYKKFDEDDRLHAARIIKFIISHRTCEVDYMSDLLGLPKRETGRLINELKTLRIIGDNKDLTAFINTIPGHKANSLNIFKRFSQLEYRLLKYLQGDESVLTKKVSLKAVNSFFLENNIGSDIESLRTVQMIWQTRGLISKKRLNRLDYVYEIQFKRPFAEIKEAVKGRIELARLILEFLVSIDDAGNSWENSWEKTADAGKIRESLVEFSIFQLKTQVDANHLFKNDYSLTDYDKALLYLNEISAIKLDRGLYVYYSPYVITRCDMNNKRFYTDKDYMKLETFYRQRIEQVHIVGEYAKILSQNYQEAMTFVEDYFSLEYPAFIKKYFPRRRSQIQKPITEKQFKELYRDLSPTQLKIIEDNRSKAILVAAGPGSGKTRVLIHKVASLLTLEDVKPEQFLMLTYSRAAALEMKERLHRLIKETIHYIDIYTFHSFAFNVAGIKGDLEQAGSIIPQVTRMIESGQAGYKVENKGVLVIDEFQDIGAEEFALIKAIVNASGDIRILAVGDDDQNIFQFRGSSVKYMKSFKQTFQAKVYHLNTNYRSKNNLVHFSNLFIKQIVDRIKADQNLVSSKPDENGNITITKYNSSPLFIPFLQDILKQLKTPADKPGTGGTGTAVLTATNEEALQIYSLLRQNGIPAKLLASFSQFDLKNLVEIRMFSHFISESAENNGDKIISQEQWQHAKNRLKKLFSRSKQMSLASNIINGFEKENFGLLEINWKEYLEEIKLEDFIFPDKESVFVSTMHKAKGKEFHRVFLFLDRYRIARDENLRVVYVAITRAKSILSIHTNGNIFDKIMVPGEQRLFDNNSYPQPQHLCLQFTHRDVYLDYFTNGEIQSTIRTLQAGDPLEISKEDSDSVLFNGRKILKFSTAVLEKLHKFLLKGYRPERIHAEYIVVWKHKEQNKNYRVVLPRLELLKESSG